MTTAAALPEAFMSPSSCPRKDANGLIPFRDCIGCKNEACMHSSCEQLVCLFFALNANWGFQFEQVNMHASRCFLSQQFTIRERTPSCLLYLRFQCRLEHLMCLSIIYMLARLSCRSPGRSLRTSPLAMPCKCSLTNSAL